MGSAPIAFDSSGATATGSSGRRPNLVYASLQLYKPSPDGSLSSPGPKFDEIVFQFNPKELSLDKSAKWARESGRGNTRSGPPQFSGPDPSKLTLEMFFDASDTQRDTVVRQVEKIFSCCVPTPDSHDQGKGSPPWVRFRWGGLTGFLAYISSVSAKYTLFTPSGVPIRATVTVTLDELAGENPPTNPSSGGLAPHRLHVVLAGDTLAGIAYAEYGKPALWRPLALANGVDDPLRLRPGTRLLLPTVESLLTDASPREVAHAR